LECDRDLDPSDQTIFEVRWLKYSEQVKIEDNTVTSKIGRKNEESEMRIASGTAEKAILQAGLVGWSNFKDANGNEVEFKRTSNKVTDECLSRLRPDWRKEIANFITDQGVISKDEEKN
jgi:hypothetical protein